MTKKKDNKLCSFCNRNNKGAGRLIQGSPDAYICNECVEACHMLFQNEQAENLKKVSKEPLTPIEIRDKLSEYIVG